jgi:hypothetical protein
MKSNLLITPIARFAGLCLIVLAATGSVQAQIVNFSTDFESDTIGAEPAGFALLKDTSFTGNSLNVIGSNSTWSAGSKSLQWLDTNTTDSNPDVFIFDELTGITQDLTLGFDFVNISGGFLRFQVYDSSGTRAIRLDLDEGGRIFNNGTSGTELEFTGQGLDRWHTIEIQTDIANDTYDISIFRNGRTEAAVFTDLAFNNAVSNFATIAFQDFAGGANTSEFYIDNISVTVVPEPGTYALILGGLALLGIIVRRRLSR